MNLYLHGIGDDDDVPVEVDDSLKSDPSEFFQMILTNPPFGKKSSITIMMKKVKPERNQSLINALALLPLPTNN
jgi:type I restriction enzyme M protein